MTLQTEPRWLSLARQYVGTREIPGPQNQPVITGWLEKLKAWWRDDDTPWCGVFVAAMLQEAGLPIPRYWMRARAYLEWGRSCDELLVGAVVVFERGAAGHVGFVVGRDDAGRIMVLGGNQGNAVTIAAFHSGRVLGVRWPNEVAMPSSNGMPIYIATGPASKNEA